MGQLPLAVARPEGSFYGTTAREGKTERCIKKNAALQFFLEGGVELRRVTVNLSHFLILILILILIRFVFRQLRRIAVPDED